MIDGGAILLIVSALMLLVPPIETVLAHRRWARDSSIGEFLQAAFPPPPTTPALHALVAKAEAALAADARARGPRDQA